MLVVFAKNQVIVDSNQGLTTIYTDAVALGDNNRATGITKIHRIFNAASGYGLQWTMQVSNNGVDFVPQGPTSGALESADKTLQAPATVTGMYARLEIRFEAAASVVGAAIFDILVNFDRA